MPKSAFLKRVFVLSLLFFGHNFINAQVANQNFDQLAALEGALSNLSPNVIQGATTSDNEFRSITQFEYENTVRNLQKINEAEELERFRNDAQKKRIELAIKLCQEDENACYLIEEYRNLKEAAQELSETELKLFGIDIFASYPLSFEQSDIGSPPSEYQIRAGDLLRINIYGNMNASYELRVERDGSLDLPSIGQVNVLGLRIEEARDVVDSFSKQAVLGISTTLSIKSVNPIQVYALGMVSNPGTYKLSSVSKAINGIIASGGFMNSSSLRSINIKRNNTLIKEIDLYELLLFGDNSNDILLENNDVIFIPPVGKTIKVFGAVNSPHIFEIKPNETLSDAIQFAQGFKLNANKDKISIRRKNLDGQYYFILDNLHDDFVLKDNDIIFVPTLESENIGFVNIFGAVKSEGIFPLKSNATLASYINPAKDLLEDTYPALGIVLRKNSTTRSFEILEFDMISTDFSKFKVNDGDKIFIFSYEDISSINSLELKQLLLSSSNHDFIGKQQLDSKDELQSLNLRNYDSGNSSYDMDKCFNDVRMFGSNDFIQTAILKLSIMNYLPSSSCTDLMNNFPELLPILINRSIPIYGSLRKPGLYPVSKGITANEAISIAGGKIHDSELGSIDIGTLELASQDELSSSDLLYINYRDSSQASKSRFVKIAGEVKFPGVYQIDSATTLLDLYEKAGGLLPSAYPLAGILSRESIKDRESTALKKAESELADILASAVASGVISQSSSDLIALVGLMNQISSAQPVGRLITEMNPQLLEKDPTLDIFLQSGDTIYIPERNNVITIFGSVLNPTTVPFNPKSDLKDYIRLAGGFKDYADVNKSYVLLPNGKAIIPNSSFLRSGDDILPGSTIIVPREARPLSGLSLVEALSPVLANLSISLASINSISNN